VTTNASVGSVDGIWMFPVKSMKGEKLAAAEVTANGLLGDRAYALIDVESGKVASAKSVRLFPELFGCKAEFVEPPQPDDDLPPVRISMPNGTTVDSDAGDADRLLSDFFNREVRLAQAAPNDFTIDQYHPDIVDADPRGHRDAEVQQKLGSAFFTEAGLPSPVSEGSFFDLFPLTVLTSSTLDQLTRLQPGSVFDERRFRMNIIINTDGAGFIENDWVGRDLAIGDEIRLNITMPDPRCVMTTLAQDELSNDVDILRTLVQHNKIEVPGAGLFPCAGVYAVSQASGSLRTGDSVSLI
jgi:uncharacterized protein YcbX